MTVSELLPRLRHLGVRFWLENDQLRYRAPAGVMTPDLRAELIEHKAEMITFLREAAQAVRTTPDPIVPVARERRLPLSFAQQRLWFIDQLEPGNPTYNIPVAVRLTGTLDVEALKASLHEIVQRHESLRTTFVTIDEQPTQSILPAIDLTLPIVDLSRLEASAQAAEIQRRAIQAAQQPFDLTRGPLVRATLLRLSEHEHVLLQTMHHIVSDWWSIGVSIRELMALYRAFTLGQPSPLPALPIQYADFAVWQREWLQGERLRTQLAYWKAQLADAAGVLELPADRPRPPLQSFQGATHSLTLTREMSAALQALSQQTGATLFMTLLAAFKTLLYRYTGQTDILIGSPIANRNRAEIEGLIGCFVNTLPLRTDLSGNPGFRELLGRVREGALGAYAHQDVPFEKLVDELKPKRDLSRTPLFQVLFILQNTPTDAVELPGLTLSLLEIDRGTAKFDLTLAMAETEHGLSGTFEYNSDLFDADTVQRLADHFRVLLSGIVADPDRPIADLPILTAEERDQIVVTWNDTQRTYPLATSLHALFEAQVAQTPEAVAASFEDAQITYRELNARANQLAHHLQQLGVGPETLVGICMERSLEMVVGLLGILKAGGAYVPLDPSYPAERLAFMLSDAQVSVLLTQHHLLSTLPAQGAKLVCLDSDWHAIAQNRAENLESRASGEHLAYMIYTSGSTGRPKGAMNIHRAIINRLFWMQEAYSLSPEDQVLQKTPFSFDVSVWEFFWPLLVGARLVVLQPGGHQDSAYLVKVIQEQAVTVLHFVPSMLQMFVQEPGLTQCTSLRHVICSGEALPFELQEHFFARNGAELHNLYGPTEAAVDVSHWTCLRNDSRFTVPIGKPIANVQLYVLDAALQPVPVGVPGELYIGGTGLGRGYWQRPDLTAEKFVPNPFSLMPGARLYKTGDQARYLPASLGNIEYLGRLDHQVKIRGFRIELGEIEAALRQQAGVREAVVLAREMEHQPGHKQLVAYLVASQQPAPSLSELRSNLQKQLPEYMVPAACVFLEALPLTPNGKVNRHALPAPAGLRPDLEQAFVAPRTPIEQQLAAIWSQVLGVKQIGVHDNFFTLGGDSILSLQIIAKANQAGLGLTPRQIFQYQTIAELATVGEQPQTISAEQGVVTGPLPLTPIQQWFFEQNLADAHHWNQAVLFETRQALDPVAARQVVWHLLRQHDALRLRFIHSAAGWQQSTVGLSDDVPFSYIDLADLARPEHCDAIQAIAADIQASLDLSKGPLIRVALFDSGSGQASHLLIVIHHLAVDGISWRILLEDMQTLYQQLKNRQAIQLPPKTTSFKAWAHQLVAYAQAGALQLEMDYWLTESQSAIYDLPLDKPGGANVVGSVQSVSMSLSREETHSLLHEVPKAYHTRIDDVLLTALVQAFKQWTGQSFLRLNLEGHGREVPVQAIDLSRTVGWFTSLFPIRLDLGARPADPGEALKAIKEQLHRLPQRGFGYGLLRYLTADQASARLLQAAPEAQVSFNYLGQFDQLAGETVLFRPASLDSGPTRSPRQKRRHLIDINGLLSNGQLQLTFSFSANLHHASTLERLAQDFERALRALILHCLSPDAGGFTPSDFPVADLNQAGLDRILAQLDIEE